MVTTVYLDVFNHSHGITNSFWAAVRVSLDQWPTRIRNIVICAGTGRGARLTYERITRYAVSIREVLSSPRTGEDTVFVSFIISIIDFDKAWYNTILRSRFIMVWWYGGWISYSATQVCICIVWWIPVEQSNPPTTFISSTIGLAWSRIYYCNVFFLLCWLPKFSSKSFLTLFLSFIPFFQMKNKVVSTAKLWMVDVQSWTIWDFCFCFTRCFTISDLFGRTITAEIIWDVCYAPSLSCWSTFPTTSLAPCPLAPGRKSKY